MYHEHITRITEEYNKAAKKYPDFAKTFNARGTDLSKITQTLILARERSDREAPAYSVESTLDEEVLEVYEAYLEGDYKHCYDELAQVGAVVIRAMNWLQEHHKEAFDGNDG